MHLAAEMFTRQAMRALMKRGYCENSDNRHRQCVPLHIFEMADE
jgi:hypothetical protein